MPKRLAAEISAATFFEAAARADHMRMIRSCCRMAASMVLWMLSPADNSRTSSQTSPAVATASPACWAMSLSIQEWLMKSFMPAPPPALAQ